MASLARRLAATAPRRLAVAAAPAPARCASSTTNAAGCVPGPNGKYTVTLFAGDGIGPEISNAVMEIFEVRPQEEGAAPRGAAESPRERWRARSAGLHARSPRGAGAAAPRAR
jgi:hypothetical protein